MAELELIPVHTRILTHHDDIVDAIKEYAGADITDHDIVCTAESVVAITQNRYVRPEELNVCWQARLMNRFVPAAGSMASIYGMQAAMEHALLLHSRRCRQSIRETRRILCPLPSGIPDR